MPRLIDTEPTVKTEGWISTAERQPDEKSAYLVRLSDGVYRILCYCNYYGGELGWYETRQEMVTPFKIRNVTHWRLLPEPPLDVNRIVPKPKWILDRLHHYKCSACGAQWGRALNMNYCPTCGQHMEGRDPDNWRYAQDAEEDEE